MPANIKKPKPPIYPPLTTKPHGGSGREGQGVQSRCPPLTAATDKSEALSKHRCPKTPSSVFYPLLARHLGTPLVLSPPPREEQETDSLTLSPLLLLLLPLALLLAAVEGRGGGGEAEVLVPLWWLSLFLCLDGWGFLRAPQQWWGAPTPSTEGNQIRLLLKIAVCSLALPSSVTFKCIFYCSPTLYLQIIKSTSRAHQDRPDITVL